MKKKLLLIMAILCLVALLAGLLVACNDKPAPQPEPPTDPSEPAEPGETGGLEFYLKEDGTYMVSNYTGSETDVVIPVKHDNKAVTEIGPSAFAYRSLITSITIPSSVTKIGDQAFYNCLSLTTINYNAAAVEDKGIDSEVFRNAGTQGEGITLTFGNNVTSIPDNLFYATKAPNIVTMTTGACVQSIGEQTFANLPTLTTVTISNSVTDIAATAFEDSTGITTATMPISAVNKVPQNSLRTVTLTDGEYLGYDPSGAGMENVGFAGCLTLESVTLPETIEHIGARTFAACKELSSLTIPETAEVMAIGDQAFYMCMALGSVTIPETVESIGDSAFFGCRSITSVNIPASVEDIGASAFADCGSLESITVAAENANYYAYEEKTLIEMSYEFSGDYDEEGLPVMVRTFEDIVVAGATGSSIPEEYSVVAIAAGAFYGSGIQSIVVPDNVKAIGESAFGGCTALSDITLPFVGTSTTGFGYIFGTSPYIEDFSYDEELEEIVFTYSDAETLVINGINQREYYVPTTLTTVTVSGFYENDGYGDLPAGDIYPYAFSGFTTLTSVAIGGGVESIGSYAFEGCTALESLEIGSGVSTIGSGIIAGCTAITSLSVVDGNDDFYDSDSNIIVENNGYGYQQDVIIAGCQTSTIPNDYDITVIGAGAFEGCVGLTSISIPSNIDEIRSNAFAGCTGLTSLTISGGVESIGAQAFRNCIGLTEITVPESVTSIGQGAFGGTIELTELTIPFVGGGRQSSQHFGYIFGTVQYVHANGDFSDELAVSPSNASTTYYIPAGLWSLNITGADDEYSSDADVAIPSYGLSNCDFLSEITIGDGVYSIGSYAFENCTSITEIVVPASVGSIGSYAFADCVSLDTVDLGEGVTSIGSYAFMDCTSLTEMVVPESVTSIGQGAFAGCSDLEEMTLPFVGSSRNGNTSSSNHLFGYIFGYGDQSSSNFTPVTQYYASGYSTTNYIPSGLTTVTITGAHDDYYGYAAVSIGYGAFYNCDMIESVTIGDGVTNIGSYAFNDCDGLTDFTTDSTGQIGSYAFYSCGYLDTVDLGESMTSIGSYAFENCTSITEIVVPESVTSIGEDAFAGCYNLTEITLPFVGSSRNGNTSSSNHLFGYIFGLGDQYSNNFNYVTQYYASGYSTTNYIPSGLATVTITGADDDYGNAAVSIGYGAFEECDMIDSLTIGEGVTSIGAYAFRDCTSITEMVVPESVTSIGQGAFAGCYNIAEITLPFVGSSRNGNTSSSNHLFGYVFGLGDQYSGSSYYTGVTQSYSEYYSVTNYIPSGLTTVTITGADDDYGYAAVSIGYGAFYGCDMIESVTIGDGVTNIGSYAFYSCVALDTVDLGESVTSIGSYAFQHTPITEIVIPDSVGSIGSYAFADCVSLDTVDLGEGVTSIGSYAFENCTSLTEMVVPDSVTSIGEDAFAGCYNLTEITLPFVGASKTSGGTSSGVFGYIFGLGAQSSSNFISVTQSYSDYSSTTNYIPDGLATVTVTGGNSSYSLPYGAFYDCGMIESVTLGDNVTAIGERAFYNCDGLTDLSVTDSIESVDDEAFYGCDSLTYNVSGNVKYLGNADNKYAVLVGVDSTSLTSVTIDSATRVILPGAFEDCTSLTEVVVPDSVVEIGEGAFAGCYNLTEITLPFVGRNDGSGSSSHLFGYIFGLGSQSSDNYTNAYQRYGSSSYTYYYIPSGLATVTVTGGNGYYDLAYGAFSGCTMIESVTLGDDVDTIGSYAFEGCTALATVDLAEGITEVGSHAFDGCTALTEIVLPDSMDYIYSYAFNNSGLTAVDLGSGIYSISANAFYGTGITSVVIPDGIYYLYDGAFDGCNSLAKVYYEGTETDWNTLISRYGGGISGAEVYYYTDSEPELNYEGTAYDGNYWYYVDGVVTEWVYEEV